MFLNLSGRTFFLEQSSSILQQIIDRLSELHTTFDNFSFFYNGLPASATISALVPLRGGKGGFGTKLKTEGGKKVRPNDNMFSRDQSGRRVVHVAQEKQFAEFIKKSMAQEKLVAEEREKLKIMESTLKEGQSSSKLDRVYKKQIQETENTLAESIRIGLQRKQLQRQKAKAQGKEAIKQEAKEEIKQVVQDEQLKVNNEEHKQESVKRDLPVEFKEEIQGDPEKKQKVEVQQPKIPKFLKAKEMFNMMKKK